MKNHTLSPSVRIAMLDIARIYGMILVYYGHIIERIMYLDNATAAMHYKFIYSFHMPFFFLLSGFAASPDKVKLGFKDFFKRLALSRLVPYVFFSAALAVASLIWVGHYVVIDLSTAKGYIEGAIATAMGFPIFNIPLWFLACLFTVEVLHRIMAPIVSNNKRLLLVAVLFYLVGYWLNLKYEFLLKGRNFWFVNEAPVVYAFYLLGVFMRRRNFLMEVKNRKGSLIAGILLMLVVVFTFNLNQGPFRLFDAVVIIAGGHGNILLFPLTAIAGSLALILLAHASGSVGWLQYMGRNVLILFCLNGVFYHFFNGPYADWYMAHFSGGAWSVFFAGCAMTAISLTVCLPVVWLLDNYFPQLVGRPYAKGPILPSFMGRMSPLKNSAQRM